MNSFLNDDDFMDLETDQNVASHYDLSGIQSQALLLITTVILISKIHFSRSTQCLVQSSNRFLGMEHPTTGS